MPASLSCRLRHTCWRKTQKDIRITIYQVNCDRHPQPRHSPPTAKIHQKHCTGPPYHKCPTLTSYGCRRSLLGVLCGAVHVNVVYDNHLHNVFKHLLQWLFTGELCVCMPHAGRCIDLYHFCRFHKCKNLSAVALRPIEMPLLLCIVHRNTCITRTQAALLHTMPLNMNNCRWLVLADGSSERCVMVLCWNTTTW